MRISRRLPFGLAAALLVAGLMVGCSDDAGQDSPEGDFCQLATEGAFDSLDPTDNYSALLTRLEAMVKVAPDDLKADLQFVVEYLKALEGVDTNDEDAMAAAAAGFDPGDLDTAWAEVVSAMGDCSAGT
ncbi:MAG: hypothetical protein LBR27_06975 [Bifidobacteriaceae bacterium]|jgi:hypothetical protein|nr:hypothetical protein [Bifidobacteriaceae bacterium]